MPTEPTEDDIKRISDASLECLKGMPPHALFTLACTVLHDAAVRLEKECGRPFELTCFKVARTVIDLGPRQEMFPDPQRARGQG